MRKSKICVVTGSRAEYGLLKNLLKLIIDDKYLDLQLVVTGMHLSNQFGLTYNEIIDDGFKIDKKVEMLISGDSSISTTKSTAIGVIGFADALSELKPDLVMVLGDRFEIFSVAIAAMFSNIPIAHIHGGETTEGAFDEAIRHSITKMSWIHFVGSEDYKKRVIQLGENPKRVFNVGGLGVDFIKETKLLPRRKLSEITGIKFKKKNVLVTYHPETLSLDSSEIHFKVLLDVLQDFSDINIIFTMPNADPKGFIIKEMIKEFVQNNNHRSIYFESMGITNYLSTLKIIDGVIGNSSSGLAEAPSFKIGTINIGDRQKGRVRSSSVIDCKYDYKSIHSAIKKLYSVKFKNSLKEAKNPYGQGGANKKIIEVLKNPPLKNFPKKKFYDQ